MQFQIDSQKLENSEYKKQNTFFYKLTLRGFANCCSFASGKKVYKSEKNYSMKYLNFLRTYVCLLLGFAAFTACTSEEDEALIPEGKGYVKLSLNADTGFQTKAVDESEYTQLDNYTVQILKDGKVVDGMEWNYADMPTELIELTNGGYELKAFYGEEYNVPSTRDGLYMEGIKTFNVNGDQQSLTVECKPVQAKIQVNFDSKMANYFSDYYVTFETEALGNENKALWEKDDTSPLYLKVNANGEGVVATFTLNKITGGQATVDPKTYTLKPLDFQTINIAPVVESNTGNVGISITINKDTNDENVNIEIPTEWL